MVFMDYIISIRSNKLGLVNINQIDNPKKYMKNTKKALKNGFSLVEMLVVIAVIGIIAAIAVPNIGRINDAAREAKDRRNAQNISSVYASALAAGHDFLNPDGAGEIAIADAISAICTDGVVIAEQGPFEGAFFGVPNLDPQDQDEAATYLEAFNGLIVYNGNDDADAGN